MRISLFRCLLIKIDLSYFIISQIQNCWDKKKIHFSCHFFNITTWGAQEHNSVWDDDEDADDIETITDRGGKAQYEIIFYRSTAPKLKTFVII